jgi:hypothetical protein
MFGFVITTLDLFPEDGSIQVFVGSVLDDARFMCVNLINFY